MKKVVVTLLGVMLLAGVPVFAQVDFTGVWNPRIGDEDNPERIPGPSLVDYLGLPINDRARQWALAYSPARLGLSEHQCQVHSRRKPADGRVVSPVFGQPQGRGYPGTNDTARRSLN